jgi:hypothetical protein
MTFNVSKLIAAGRARWPRLSRGLLRAAVPLAVAGLVVACASIIGPRQIDLPQERMQQSLDRRFPMHQRALGVFEVELSHPRLDIIAENDRVSLSLDASVSPLLARQSWTGTMVISGRLQADQQRNAIFLRDAHVDRFVIDNLDEGRQRQIASIANLLSENVTKDMPLHTFRPEDLRYAGVQFVLTNIATRPGGLVATVAPAQ